MSTLRHHILYILFIAIAFSTGCHDNTPSQNDTLDNPKDTTSNPTDTLSGNNPKDTLGNITDTVFLAAQFKKVTITYSNVLAIGKHKLLTNGYSQSWTDTLLWSYDKGYGTRGSDRQRNYGLSTFINTTKDVIYGNTGFSGYYLKSKNEIAVLSAGYYSTGHNGPEDIYSSVSIRLYNLPFMYQQDSSIGIALTGKEAEQHMFYLSYVNNYHRMATGSHNPEAEENDDYKFYQCTDSTQIDITLQR